MNWGLLSVLLNRQNSKWHLYSKYPSCFPSRTYPYQILGKGEWSRVITLRLLALPDISINLPMHEYPIMKTVIPTLSHPCFVCSCRLEMVRDTIEMEPLAVVAVLVPLLASQGPYTKDKGNPQQPTGRPCHQDWSRRGGRQSWKNFPIFGPLCR